MIKMVNSLETRLLAVVLTLLLILGVVLGGMAYLRQADLVEERMLADVRSNQEMLMALWRDEGKRVHALAEMILLVPGVTEAFEVRDRARLLELTHPLYLLLSEHHGIGQVQFHTTLPESFLRLNAPSRFGDSLSFRKALVWVNREKKLFVGAEQGRTGLFIRGLLPVFRNGFHLGSLEVGSDVRPLLELTHTETGADYALFSTEAEIEASGFVVEKTVQGHPLLFTTNQEILSHIPEGFLFRALEGKTVNILAGKDEFMASPVINAIDEIVGVLVTRVDASKALAALANLRLLFAVAVLLSVVVGFLLLSGMLRLLVLRPLKKVTALSSSLALEGDLSQDVPDNLLRRNDEIGLLARSLQTLAESLRKQIGAVGDVSSKLGDLARDILSAVSQVASGSEETAAAVMETTATMEDIHRAAGTTDSKSHAVAENARRGLQSVRTASESMELLWDGLERIRERMSLLAGTIVRLGEQGHEILGITETMEEISEESNLLAVNAALEAAKAEEHGRGFSVVAKEIRQLAEHSKQSARQVKSILKETRKATDAAVLAASQGTEAVEQGTEQAAPSRESFRNISKGFAESAESAARIAAANSELLSRMEQAANAMASIKEASLQNLTGMKEIESAARSLNEMSETLSALLGHYRMR